MQKAAVLVVPGRAVQLSDGGQEVPDAVERPNLVIGIAPGGPPAAGDRDSFARLAFASPPNLKDARILSSEPMRPASTASRWVIRSCRMPPWFATTCG